MKFKILLKQHIGAPCTPVPAPGASVRCGELLASPCGLGAPIYSPFEGVISEITEDAVILDVASLNCYTGTLMEECTGGRQTSLSDHTDVSSSPSFLALTGNTEEELLSSSGLVGMGGAGFPTSVKCRTDLKGGYILVNAAECEPLLHHNILQLEKNAPKTLEGIKILLKLCNAGKGIIAIKEKHKKAIEILEELCKKEPDISVHLLPDLYPMGEERAVVREVLGTLLKPTDLPSAAQAIVINAETVQRVAEAVLDHRPCITKNISVAGKLKGGTHTRVFFDVPIGTTVGQLIEQAGGIDGEYGEIIMGGPFTGKAVTPDTPVTKTTGGIIVTAPFEDLKGSKLGLLLCACGGNETRMKDLAQKMNGEVVLVQKCKQAADIKGTLKCENPGNCPGQAQKCLNFKKAGCTDILIGNCSDCTNTVMGSAPKLGLTVHHQTDHVFDTVGLERMRHLTNSKTTEAAKAAAEPETESGSEETVIPEHTSTVYHVEQVLENGILKIDIKEGRDIHIELPVY